jgi:hypothetical protein
VSGQGCRVTDSICRFVQTSQPCYSLREEGTPTVRKGTAIDLHFESKLDHQPVKRLTVMGEQRDRSVLMSDTVIIISYHELSRVD